jgi:hypothetical protein
METGVRFLEESIPWQRSLAANPEILMPWKEWAVL